MTKATLSFNTIDSTKQLLKALPNERSLNVLVRRYGIGDTPNVETLESVGKTYGITRERVRQIENHALKAIRKSDAYSKISKNLRELADLIDKHGGVIPEDKLIEMLGCTEKTKNHILFLLSVAEEFKKKKENPEFVQHWYTREGLAHTVREGLRKIYRKLSKDIVIPQEEIVELYREHLDDHPDIAQHKDDDGKVVNWLSISKKIARNPLGEWGLATSPAVRVRSIRDYAYLTLKRHGSPMHFSEVATTINELFGKQAHSATTHNELIKDPRFVLVGRGLYALTEWGYTQGVVRDVIKYILEKNGPLTKQEIVNLVKRERYVKDNTIAVNLQNTKIFKHLPDGKYTLA